MELEHGVSSGVALRALGEDLVPLYEEHSARLERAIDLDTWSRMDPDEKALVIAARRIRIAVDNLQADAEIRAARRGARRGGK